MPKLSEVLERQRAQEARRKQIQSKPGEAGGGEAAKVSPVVTAEPADEALAPSKLEVYPERRARDRGQEMTEAEVAGAMGAHPQLVYLDQIDLDPEQPRRVTAPTAEQLEAFYPDANEQGSDPSDLQALARSVHIHGLLNPLVIDRWRGRFKLVAGERRYWAARLLGWRQVPAVIWGQLSPVHRLALQITENLQRQDLGREAKKRIFLRLTQELEGNVSEACRLLSISRATYYRTVGEEASKPERRVSSGQLVRVLEGMRERLPNMARADQVKVLAALDELQGWLHDKLAAGGEGA